MWTHDNEALELTGLSLDSEIKPAYLALLAEANATAWSGALSAEPTLWFTEVIPKSRIVRVTSPTKRSAK